MQIQKLRIERGPSGRVELSGLGVRGSVAGDVVAGFQGGLAVLDPIRIKRWIELFDHGVGGSGIVHVIVPVANGSPRELCDDVGMVVSKDLRGVEDAVGGIASVAG